jgi:hypothetical protein
MEFNENIPFGLFGQGKTIAETISDFNNSYAEIKAMYADENKDCPVLEFDFR